MRRNGTGSVTPSSFARLGRRSVGPTMGINGTGSAAERNGGQAEPGRGSSSPRVMLRPGSRQETLREANLLLISEEIFASSEPLSRADLAIRTGMTRSTVSRLVDDLLAAGIVREGSPMVGGTRGRPAVPLTPARRTLIGLGVEVNVGFTAARALDLTGAVLAEEFIAADHRASDPREVLWEAGKLALRVAAEAAAAGGKIVGTVLAIPGLVDSDERSLLLAPNLGWKDVDVVELLRAAQQGASPHSGPQQEKEHQAGSF